jgi:putative DNA primase/helicase
VGTNNRSRRPQSARISAAELKRQIPDVSRVAQDLYGIEFRNGVGRCPFPKNHNHQDRDPSLRYDRTKKRIFCASQNCFSEKGADAIALIQAIDRCSFAAAVQRLEEHYGISHSNGRSHAAANGSGPARTKKLILAESVRRTLAREGFQIAAEYGYGPLLRRVRFEHASQVQEDKKRPEKTFRWEHCLSGTWYSGDGGLPRPLYVNQVFRDRDQLGLVLGFEGEGKADLAGEFGIAAFSFKDITAEHATTLAEGEVVVWPDNDEAGRKAAIRAATIIHESGVAATIKTLAPPAELGIAEDIIDAVQRLGWGATEIRQFIATAESIRVTTRDAPSRPVDGGDPGAGPRAGSDAFRLTDECVIHVNADHEGDQFKICGHLQVVALTRDTNGENWGRLLRWLDAEGGKHEWALPMSLLTGDGSEYRGHLLDGGLVIAPGRRARELLTTYIQTARTEARALSVSRLGWHGRAFVLPGGTIGQNAGEPVIYQSPFQVDHYFRVKGTVEDWRERVGKRCGGNSRLILAVSCAFAGPALGLLGLESGGIHFHGSTSMGKSTALLVGGSVCGGGGRNGFVRSWRSTANGVEAIAELHNDSALFLDELSQADPREVAEIVYLLGNGAGKTRMNRGMGARRPLNWTVLYVSSGELTLAEHALAGNRRIKGGADVRQINIEGDAGAGMGLFENIHGASSADEFARMLVDSAKHHYGAPLRAYIELLTADLRGAQLILRAHVQSFIAGNVPAGASGEVSRAAVRFAAIAAAGELATKWELTGWQDGDATVAVERCFKEWMAVRGTTGSSDMERAIRQVRWFLGANGASRFQLLNPVSVETAGERIANRAGFKRLNGVLTEYLILKETFKNEVCAGFNPAAVLQELDRREWLVREHPNMTVKTRLPELGSTRVYCIRETILEGDET